MEIAEEKTQTCKCVWIREKICSDLRGECKE